MAIGKNKRASKGGKKGSKKKVIDPFSKKDWYDIKAPNLFSNQRIGKTLVTRSQGTKLAATGLLGRIYIVNLADLNNDEDQSFRKIKLICETVQGKNCLTNFHGMDITRDRLCSIVKKWHTLIEAHVDVKTVDGFFLRMSCLATTKRRPEQLKSTCYAQTAQIRQLRKRMRAIMTAEAQKLPLKDLVKKFIPEAIGKQIEKRCQSIFPLQNVLIRKVKILKKPPLDHAQLASLYDTKTPTEPLTVGQEQTAVDLLGGEADA